MHENCRFNRATVTRRVITSTLHLTRPNTVILAIPELRPAILTIRSQHRVPLVQIRLRDTLRDSEVVATLVGGRSGVLVAGGDNARLRGPSRLDLGRAAGLGRGGGGLGAAAAGSRLGGGGGRGRLDGGRAGSGDADAVVLAGPERATAVLAGGA